MRAMVIVLLCSCSVFKNGPAANAPTREHLDCSPSRAAPNVDAGFTVLWSIGVLAAIPDLGEDSSDGRLAAAFGGTFAVLAILQGLSAWSGYRKASRCEAAWNRLQPATVNAPVKPPGSEAAVCRVPPYPACDAGLVCASSYCVRPPQ